MDKYLAATRKAVDRLSEALGDYEDVQVVMRELLDYYDSDLWMNDIEDDEQGRLPADLSSGVLSEDAVYNLLEDNHDIMVRMLKVITELTEGGSV